MRDQKYLRKNMHKVCQLSVKEAAMKIVKRSDVSSRLHTAYSTGNLDQLKLDYQPSIVSLANENLSAQGSLNPEAHANIAGDHRLDYDEGI